MKSGENNMPTHKHYIPILKWKGAEQGALKTLDEERKKRITPLIQFVMPRQKPNEQLEDVVRHFEEQIEKMPEKILDVWGTSPVFVDFSLLYTTELKAKSIESLLSKSLQYGIRLIPTAHLGDDAQIHRAANSVAKKNNSGICLRLICSDFKDINGLNKRIGEFLASYKLSPDEVDLLVDIKEIEENGTKYNQYLSLSQRIINLSEWRSFIFAAGAFPKDLTNCKLDEENLLPRLDWQNWLKEIKNSLARKPAFSDYTIQHPIYEESSQFFHPTTSIKYSLENDWLIMKGKKQKYNLYLANAKLLSQDSRFSGENFSSGDKYIADRARHYDKYIKNPEKEKGTGNAKTWIEAGINHHLSLVAHQVSSLV
jgi:hypothetical protein